MQCTQDVGCCSELRDVVVCCSVLQLQFTQDVRCCSVLQCMSICCRCSCSAGNAMCGWDLTFIYTNSIAEQEREGERERAGVSERETKRERARERACEVKDWNETRNFWASKEGEREREKRDGDRETEGERKGLRGRRLKTRNLRASTERDCFDYIIVQTYDVGLHSRRHYMELDAGIHRKRERARKKKEREREGQKRISVFVFASWIFQNLWCWEIHEVGTFWEICELPNREREREI